MGRAAPLSQVFMTSDVQKNDFEAYNGDDELGYINFNEAAYDVWDESD